MRCFQIKFNWYTGNKYVKKVTHIIAETENDANNEIHKVYQTNPYRPCFILKIKEIHI